MFFEQIRHYLCVSTIMVSVAFFPAFSVGQSKTPVIVGAERLTIYLPDLQGRRVALVANHSSRIGETHLLDTLRSCGINVTRIFTPEHGFRGEAEAGAIVKSSVDVITGIPIVSLYGKNKKPHKNDLDVDIVLFDIQDVGARFYTYISTLHYVMEACAENQVPLIVTDRPNPNGFYTDGPVLDTALRSFVGMHPVPIVHGMTIGEYAKMINGEQWLDKQIQCQLTVIPMENYTHETLYSLAVAPSPNLQTSNAILLYPSICWLEGTKASVGRGTDKPFESIGYPEFPDGEYRFLPTSRKGISEHPPYENKPCGGIDLQHEGQKIIETKQLQLSYLIAMYEKYPQKESFFTPFFDKLSGNKNLKNQIKAGLSEGEIRKTWEKDLEKYRQMRKKYLIYD